MSEDADKVTTSVSIYNRTYNVRSGNDPEYVKELARHVDNKMVELSEHTPTVDSLKVAILAALTIADDYFSVCNRLANLEREVSERSGRMMALVKPVIGARRS